MKTLTIICAVVALSSCGVPVTVKYVEDGVALGYSSKGGLTVEASRK